MSAVLPNRLSPVEEKLKLWQPRPDIPSWFTDLRARARDAYFRTALPNRHNEAWHYGEPRRFTLDGLDIAHAQPGFNGISYERICGLTRRPWRIACLSMVGDNVAEISSSTPLKDAGITVMSLRQAIALRGDQLRPYWTSDLVPINRDRLRASHFALVDNGFYVHIPKGVEAPEAIHLIMETGEPGSVVAPHVVIVSESQAKADVFVHFLGTRAEGRNLQLGMIRTYVHDGAQVTVTKIQHVGRRTDSMTHEAARVGANATYRSVVAHFGGNHVRHEVVARLAGAGSHAELLGMHLLRGRQRYDFHTHQDHLAPGSTSNLLFKGALMDRTRASYQGIITIANEAQQSDAYQANRSLLLSPQARADSSPQLEISANDVRCSHGSTISNVGANELFYMQNRGIDPDHARRLLVSGFMAEIADRIPLSAVRDYAYNYVLKEVA